MMLPRYIARTLGLALVALLVVGCGGLNESEKDRRARVGAEEDAGPSTTPEEDADTTPVPDAAIPPRPDAAVPDAAPPVPAGSFAAGTELETTANLNLRDGPGVEFAIIVQVPIGTVVKVQKTSGADGWVNIVYNANVGYSSKEFLKTVP